MTTVLPMPALANEIPMPARISLQRVLEIVGEPKPITRRKILDRLDVECRKFIAHSPFLCLATANRRGEADCSPRGDRAGFVKVLNEMALAIPDRPGNKLLDSVRNIDDQPGVGLIFFVPGMSETLRVNGRAYFTEEPALLRSMVAGSRIPDLAIVVEVDQVYLHCGKALIRSGLWEQESQVLAIQAPTAGAILAAAMKLEGVTEQEIGEIGEREYRENLY